MALTIHNKEAFARYVERVVRNSNMSYIDVILDFCEKRQLEPEQVAGLINTKIKRALAREGRDRHLLVKRPSLAE